MEPSFNAYHQWLGIPPKDQPPHHYRLLGIELFESDPGVIESAADRQMSHVRSFQTGKHAAESQQLLNELAAAKVCLLKPATKAEYDELLMSRLPKPPQTPPGSRAAAPAEAAAPIVSAPSTTTRVALRSRKRNSPWRVPLAISAIGVASVVLLLILNAQRQDPPQPVAQGNAEAKTPPVVSGDPAVRPPETNAPVGSAPDNAAIVHQPETSPEELEEDPQPIQLGEWVELLDMVDPARHSVMGQWIRRGQEVVIEQPAPQGRIMVPVQVNGSYELDIRFTNHNGDVRVVLPVGTRSCMLAMGAWDRTVYGLAYVDGKGSNANSSTVRSERIPPDREHRVECRVQVNEPQATIEVDFNSRSLIRWQGHCSSLSIPREWALPNADAIGLCGYAITYHSARLRLTSGTAKPFE